MLLYIIFSLLLHKQLVTSDHGQEIFRRRLNERPTMVGKFLDHGRMMMIVGV